MTHQNTQSHILKAASSSGMRLFINRVAAGWVGVIITRTANVLSLGNYRPIRAGLGVGSSDLVGFTPIKITPDMVGRKVAVFTAVEVKAGRDKLSQKQRNFLRQINAAGGIGVEARSPADVSDAVARFESG